MALSTIPVSNNLRDPNSISSRWGITAYEYRINHLKVDLQDLLVAVSKNRAIAVEGEVNPQATRIRKRNDRLNQLGKALSNLTEVQASVEKDTKGSDYVSVPMNASTAKIMRELGYMWGQSTGTEYGFYADSGSATDPETGLRSKFFVKRQVLEGMIQRLRSEIDGANNEAQLDMSRLQQLVDRRDESYSTATNLMTEISDTRGNVIRNY